MKKKTNKINKTKCMMRVCYKQERKCEKRRKIQKVKPRNEKIQ